jgi:cyclopropane-fatty-acyl-phospholipid synthase
MARTEPLLRELSAALPDRPFHLELWDGSSLPATNGGGPTFRARSKAGVAHAVRAPGQLGLGRAYVSGALVL